MASSQPCGSSVAHPWADAVIAATIFQHHFPSMRAMQCDRKGDSGIVCIFDASWLVFILFVHFILLAVVDASYSSSRAAVGSLISTRMFMVCLSFTSQ